MKNENSKSMLGSGGNKHTFKSNINIITNDSLMYVDTLYLYYKNIFDTYDEFIDFYATNIFNKCISILGDSNGRSWFDFSYYRIGVILDYDKANRSNQYLIEIQYKWEHLISKGVYDVLLPFGGNKSDYHIKRIDITRIVDLDKSLGDVASKQEYIYKTKFRVDNEYLGTRYLGNRKNGAVYRIYNKTKELKDNDNLDKLTYYSAFFNDVTNLYTFELELLRKYMLPLGIDKFSDLSKVYALYYNIVGGIEFFRLNDYNKKCYRNKNYDRIDVIYKIENKQEFSRLSKKLDKNKFTYNTSKQLSKIAKQYSKLYGVELNDIEIMKLVDEFVRQLIDTSYDEINMIFEFDKLA